MITQKQPSNVRLDQEYLRQVVFTLNQAIDNSNTLRPRAVDADTDVIASDGVLLVDATSAAVTLTLPDPREMYAKEFVAVKVDSSGNAMELDAGSSTINGSATQSTSTQWGKFRLYSDGEQYYLV